MQEVIDLIFYILERFWSLIFGLYIVEGVSIGMLLIVMLIFSTVIRYAIAIPKSKGRGVRSVNYHVNDRNNHV